MFLTGDFNVNLLDTEGEEQGQLIEMMLSYDLTQEITDPTRFSVHNNPTLIDHFYSNSDHIASSGTLCLNISDHELIFIIRKMSKKKTQLIDFKGRSYRTYNHEVFTTNLLEFDWIPFYQLGNVDIAWSQSLTRITTVLDKMCPLKEIHIKKKKDPWITNELIELINDKKISIKKGKEDKSPR